MFRVAIVGRPNVGKSTLFNRLTRTRKAIVGDEPGITRDRLSQVVHWDGQRFELFDTGGMVPGGAEEIPARVLEQARLAIDEADLILFVVDVRQGVTPLDQELSALLRPCGKEIFLVVNKVDAPPLEAQAMQFHELGLEPLYCVSAEHKLGTETLLEAVLARVPEEEEASPAEPEEIRVAIVGRPNVGKSSLLNRLLGKERMIVSEVPGTTRDAVDTVLVADGQTYRLIDTAGIRRKGRTQQLTEKLSVIMARKNMERADVVLLVMDAVEGVTQLDATIGGYAARAGASIILVVNKWDLVPKDTSTAAHLEKEFRMRLRFLDYAPLVFVSAKSGQRVSRLLSLAGEARTARRIRVPTAELNDFLDTGVRPLLESAGGARKFPLLYASQVSVDPPTFVFFTRSSRPLHFSTERFLSNQLRSRYGFFATPLRVVQRTRKKP